MHPLLPTFQRRTDLILRGQIDEAVRGYLTPFWTRFRGTFYQITSTQDLWEALSRQHLSQMARGIIRVQGEVEAVEDLPHGAQRVTMHWKESCDMRAGDTARWYRTIYVCRQLDSMLKVVGLTLTETRPVPEDLLPKGFPPPCQDW